MKAFGWLVLALVFLDELLAAAAAAVWGNHAGGVLLAVAMVVVVIAVWWVFASPKAPKGGPVVRPVTKVLVFGLASVGLWVAGHHGWALAFLVFSVVVNGLAQLPAIQALVREAAAGERPAA
ncbi:Protein of unknown function [Pedococcus dokdonensis]|uniref:DUF2568 domain-containing protein n=1 Tax=Pedococcus dokdonensis TaxID=443156 RepID=A0A1H0TSN2_9MICO|nr:DUF2568 domain-containing protein [Pedococcus dokdonensis]SDP56994.1 Protein of unknown function [Pedococcus dokdonensis]